jgi:hypothetical protein
MSREIERGERKNPPKKKLKKKIKDWVLDEYEGT